MISIQTKRAKVSIIEVKKISSKADKLIFKDMRQQKKILESDRLAGRDILSSSRRTLIQEQRAKLRTNRFKKYVFEITVMPYNSPVVIEDDYDMSGASIHTFKAFVKGVVDSAIRQGRYDRKAKGQKVPVKIGPLLAYKLGNKKVGFVHADEGDILKAHVTKNMKRLYDAKAPVLGKKYIGIELEFCAPISESKLALKLFQKGLQKFVQLKTDGSLRPEDGENGYELAVLLEEGSYKKDLKKVMDVLTAVKAVAKNRRCGLHVHIDMRRRNKELVYNNLVACQFALLSVVDPIRYNNEFCQVVHSRRFPEEFTGERSERYKTINAAAYYKFKTLEVRMHEGSVDYKEITNWVDLLIKVVNYSKRFKNNITRLPILHKRIKLKDTLYKYVIERSCSWQVQNSEQLQAMRADMGGNRVLSASPSYAVSASYIQELLRPASPTGVTASLRPITSYQEVSVDTETSLGQTQVQGVR